MSFHTNNLSKKIDDIKNKQTGDLEIEVTDAEPLEESKPKEQETKPKPKTEI